MARHESDREDLMREATALIRRAELSYPGRSENDPVITGFRRDQSLAVYFGADPVYQFDDQHRLRRAFVSGHLYRTQGQTLARLTREHRRDETVLHRHDLNADELQAFLQSAKNQLTELHRAIASNAARVLATIPADGDLLPELEAFLAEVLRQELPLAPAIAGKR
jgi:hypothetical protein